LILKNYAYAVKILPNKDPGIVTIRRIFRLQTANTRPPWEKKRFCCELPAQRRGIHRKNFVRGLSTLAFHEINNESAGKYQLIDVESTVRMGFLLGITSSGTINPPEEGDSTGNYQLIYSDSGR
jgi:hypothetical protein